MIARSVGSVEVRSRVACALCRCGVSSFLTSAEGNASTNEIETDSRLLCEAGVREVRESGSGIFVDEKLSCVSFTQQCLNEHLRSKYLFWPTDALGFGRFN